MEKTKSENKAGEVNSIQIGDIFISSQQPLRVCSKLVKELVRDKIVRGYLDKDYTKSKIMKMTGVG